jgi:hypothetical protein
MAHGTPLETPRGHAGKQPATSRSLRTVTGGPLPASQKPWPVIASFAASKAPAAIKIDQNVGADPQSTHLS